MGISDDEFGVPRHPIRVVAERTGLTQELLRAWERRYGVVAPGRGAAGERLYSDADVERLRLLQRATEGGRSIGQVASLAPEEVARLVMEDEAARHPRRPEREPVPPAALDRERNDALALCIAMDAYGLEVRLRRALHLHGLPTFLESIAAPLLRELGDLWHAGRLKPAQEHLGTATVERVVISATAAVPPVQDAPRIVLSTLPGERHAVGVLLAAALAVAEGWQVTQLGPDLPPGEIARTAEQVGAAAVGVSVIFLVELERTARDLRALRAALPAGVRLLVGGSGSAALAEEGSVPDALYVRSVSGMRDALRDSVP